MIEIGTAELNAAKKIALDKYIEDTLHAYKRKDSHRVTCAGETHFREFILLSVEKAKKYNMMADREVHGIRSLMYSLGSSFDEDPLLPWARLKRFPDKDVTKPDQEPESYTVLKSICDKFLVTAMQTQGESSCYLVRALENIVQLNIQTLTSCKRPEQIVQLLEELYPEYLRTIAGNVLYEYVIPAADKAAFQFGLDQTVGRVIFTGLMLFCGSGVIQDPLYYRVFEYLEQIPVSAALQKERTFLVYLQQLAKQSIHQILTTEG